MDMARRRPYRRQISHIAPRFGPEDLMVMAQLPLQRGTPVITQHPLAARLLPRLLYQLRARRAVTIVGILLLDNLAKVPDAPPITAPVETAINAEAVFKIMPREPSADAEQNPGRAKARPPRAAGQSKPPVAAAAAAIAQGRERARGAARQVSSAPAPLPTVQIRRAAAAG